MPELPDIIAYREALEERVQGARIDSLQIASPFVLRTVEPSVASLAGQTVTSVERLGKRVVIGTSEATYLVIHLMIAGRFR